MPSLSHFIHSARTFPSLALMQMAAMIGARVADGTAEQTTTADDRISEQLSLRGSGIYAWSLNTVLP